jgi:hypothetical protein
MKRFIAKDLSQWAQQKDRKVLLLRGARQIGKTYSIRELGKSFKYFLEVNFEEDKTVRDFFSGSLNPEAICQKLSAYYSIPIIPGETLVFFDEIQSCLDAIRSLRFFYEKQPELHVVAAGSLLEFAFSEIPSQGVGRITSLFMVPLTFREFLMACGEDELIKLLHEHPLHIPLDSALHNKSMDLLKTYQLVGGMPAVVRHYIQNKDLQRCQIFLNDLIITLQDDFAKYKKRVPVIRLKEVFESVVHQSGGKFKYSNIQSTANHASLKEALELLVTAGLVYKVYHSSCRGLPLGAQVDPGKFKVIPFDLGIYQRLLGLDISQHILAKNFDSINKGHIAEIFVGLELIGNDEPQGAPQLYYWHRESRGSNAEVDYVLGKHRTILPIEVKSGSKGQMQSLLLFLKERQLSQGIRISLENFSHYEPIQVMPLYAAWRLLIR